MTISAFVLLSVSWKSLAFVTSSRTTSHTNSKLWQVSPQVKAEATRQKKKSTCKAAKHNNVSTTKRGWLHSLPFPAFQHCKPVPPPPSNHKQQRVVGQGKTKATQSKGKTRRKPTHPTQTRHACKNVPEHTPNQKQENGKWLGEKKRRVTKKPRRERTC